MKKPVIPPKFTKLIHEYNLHDLLKNSHGISYDVARKDLIAISDDLKLLEKTKKGKQYYFVVPTDLEQRIKNI